MHPPYNMVQYLAIAIGVLAGITALIFYKEYKIFKPTCKFIVGGTVAAAVAEITGASLVNTYTDDPTVGLCLIAAALLRLAAFRSKNQIVPVVIAGVSAGARGTAIGLSVNNVALAKNGAYDPYDPMTIIVASAYVFAISTAVTIGETILRARKCNADKKPSEEDPLLPKGVTASATTLQQLPPTHQPPASQAHERQK